MDAHGAREVKVVLLGDVAVGKTCLSLRFVNDTMEAFSESTIGLVSVAAALAGHLRWAAAGPLHFRIVSEREKTNRSSDENVQLRRRPPRISDGANAQAGKRAAATTKGSPFLILTSQGSSLSFQLCADTAHPLPPLTFPFLP